MLLGNIGTLPVEIGATGLLTLTLTAAEMDADRVTVLIHDVAGAEWQDMTLVIQTVAANFDTLNTLITALNNLSAAQVNAEVDTAITDAQLATAANLAIIAGYLDTEIAAILADTNELQGDWTDGGRLDLLLDAIKAVTDAIPDAGALTALLASIADLPTNAELTTALGTADDAVLAAIAALNDPTAAAIATAVWSAVTRTLTSGGGAGGASAADIWSYHVRTLTDLAAAWAGEDLALVRGVTFGANLSGLSIPATWAAAYMTVKASPSTSDATAAVQIKVSNPGDAGDGLLYLAGAVAGTAAWGSLSVDAALGTAVIALQDDATALLTAGVYGYDIKALKSDGTSVLVTEGSLSVRLTETETI